METVTININAHTPDTVLPVEDQFRGDYDYHAARGLAVAKGLTVAIVGMARNIGAMLPHTIRRLEAIGECFKSWSAVVVENDSIDNTKDVLKSWADSRPGQVVADCRDLGREHLHGFERARVERYAEYRNRSVHIAEKMWPDADVVLAVDLDPWGGYSLEGVLSSAYWLDIIPHAAGMASTSLYQAATPNGEKVWAHYDQWAFRQWSWTPRWDQYFLQWLPPAGVEPIPVRSAFGACVLYHTEYLFNRGCRWESIDGDIEHVGLHRQIADAGGQMYLNPASRVVMHWHP